MASEKSRNIDAAEMLHMTIGSEADFYLEHMRELEPGRFAVIKVGGETVKEDLDLLAGDIAMLAKLGLSPVIVHGANPQINADLGARGIVPKKHKGMRITDDETLESVEKGLGQVNQTLVEALEAKGVEAVGVTGGVFMAQYIDIELLGNVGEVESVQADEIQRIIEKGGVPIVSCLGQDADGKPLNINGDIAARALSAQMQPHRFIMLTNTPGVFGRDGAVISVLNDTQKVEELIADGTISEGMIPKVESGMKALQDLPDESSVVITNPQQLIKELFTHQGGGTLLRHGDVITYLPSLDAVNKQAVGDLIEQAFGKRLVDDYFDRLPEDAEIFITDRDYGGLAIVFPGKDGQPSYVDKLVVRPENVGYGIGDEIIGKVCEKHPEGVFWRVRKDNKSLDWYRSKGRGQEYDLSDDEWIVFFTKEVRQDDRARYAAAAIMREQTVLPITAPE